MNETAQSISSDEVTVSGVAISGRGIRIFRS
jgi:hypothetical protein